MDRHPGGGALRLAAVIEVEVGQRGAAHALDRLDAEAEQVLRQADRVDVGRHVLPEALDEAELRLA